jgi:hypothetical protein
VALRIPVRDLCRTRRQPHTHFSRRRAHGGLDPTSQPTAHASVLGRTWGAITAMICHLPDRCDFTGRISRNRSRRRTIDGLRGPPHLEFP